MDWRELFAKYVSIVDEHEGITFLYSPVTSRHHGIQWTEEEFAAINELLEEKGIEW